MRVLSIAPLLALAVALLWGLADAHAQDVKALVQDYQARADQIAVQALFSEFAKPPDRVHHLSFTFSLQIDAQGRPHDVKILSKPHNPYVEDTARRVLSATKFPPMTKKVVAALGPTRIQIEGDVDADVSR
jgi:hypothetical protein